MPDCSHLYRSATDNVKAEDLNHRAWTLTIASAAPEDCSGKQDREPDEKVVVEFHETQKRFPLNYTNWATISSLYGVDPDEWAGRQIVLYPTETDSPRGRVPCIRCRRPESPAPAQPPATPPATSAAANVMTGAELARREATSDNQIPF